jgi:SAM-dependent methyltransferase
VISPKRYKIAQEAEKQSHILKKDINIFDRRLSSAKERVLPYIKNIEDKLKKSEVYIIDIGSGPTCLARFFTCGNKVYLDPLMDFYKEYYKDKLPSDGLLIKAMAENMPFPDKTFEVALCYNVFDHCFQPAKIIEEIERILKPGGYLLLGIYTHNPILKCLRLIAEKSWIFKEKPHPHSFTMQDIEEMFKEGFITQEASSIKGGDSLLNFKRRLYLRVLQRKG